MTWTWGCALGQLSFQELGCSFGNGVGPLVMTMMFVEVAIMKIMLMLMTPHLFPCGAHDTAHSPVKKAKSARHCFSCSKRKFYMFALHGLEWLLGDWFTKVLEEKEEERNPDYWVDYCHQLEIDYYHHFLSLLSRSVLQNLSPLSLWSLVSVSDRGNKDDRVEERTWQKKINAFKFIENLW